MSLSYLKLELQRGEGTGRERLPIPLPTLRRLLRLFQEALRDEREWIETCAILGGTPRTLALRLCGDQEMREIHRRYKHLDRATDVLSFPTREIRFAPGGTGKDEDFLHLGDLLISLETVERAARRARRTVQEEFLEVFFHGCLHLIGMDHLGKSAEARRKALRMRRIQRELCQKGRRFI